MLENPGIPLIFRIPTHDGTKIDYQPLKPSEIRLFILDPGSSTDALSGRIQQSSWGTDYEALSYVWGDVQDSTTMCIDGHTVSVTRSLGTALDHLRYPGRSRKLWIDYICINQDVVERSQQVAKMGLIYENSKSVLIWLGPSTLYSPVGMDIIRYFADAEKPQDRPVWQTYPQPQAYQGLQDVLTRKWFERMWVVQEIGRSHYARLICGGDFVEWQSTDSIAVRRFIRMIKYAEILPEWTKLGLDAVDMRPLLEILDFQEVNQFSKSWGLCTRSAPDLLDIAHTMRYKECSDPRDMIFGIWGMVDYLYHLEDFKLDYSMTVKQVYEEVARVSFQ
ncbi:hypothetical protein BFJ63_vAg17504 [Fusarium oxysporum f. sp. narcissi]|uniref:Heterokaryon incompatibility domain-containing protein n=2 Tax=Fusarium oxysporum TaxID=5507 RepID=A0A4Q2UYQ5_FUSOX|nr:hypothetical protein BFJ63_vAg17504 [Fusarium oxysporum f. sp. narcissi]